MREPAAIAHQRDARGRRVGGRCRDRTCDFLRVKQTLYR